MRICVSALLGIAPFGRQGKEGGNVHSCINTYRQRAIAFDERKRREMCIINRTWKTHF